MHGFSQVFTNSSILPLFHPLVMNEKLEKETENSTTEFHFVTYSPNSQNYLIAKTKFLQINKHWQISKQADLESG